MIVNIIIDYHNDNNPAHFNAITLLFYFISTTQTVKNSISIFIFPNYSLFIHNFSVL